MKALYAIQDANGFTLCYQIGRSTDEALSVAKNFYGFISAVSAVFIRHS